MLPEIGNLTKLEYFDLGGNDLTDLPLEVGQSVNLQMRRLEGNPLEALRQRWLSEG